MREDFDKVLTERPRVGGGGAYRSGKRMAEKELHEDFSIKQSPMSMGRGSKEFTDLISPLYRWMEKQVGRPWNKVYSDIKVNFGSNNLQHQHLFQHVKWMVELNCFKRDHKIYNSMGLEVNSFGSRRPQFYVMDDGILKVSKKPRNKFKPNEDTSLKKIGDKAYKNEDGIWYEVEHVEEVSIYLSKPIWIYRKKKQLNKKEKKRLGLT
jgi:hypothetical protein